MYLGSRGGSLWISTQLAMALQPGNPKSDPSQLELLLALEHGQPVLVPFLYAEIVSGELLTVTWLVLGSYRLHILEVKSLTFGRGSEVSQGKLEPLLPLPPRRRQHTERSSRAVFRDLGTGVGACERQTCQSAHGAGGC